MSKLRSCIIWIIHSNGLWKTIYHDRFDKKSRFDRHVCRRLVIIESSITHTGNIQQGICVLVTYSLSSIQSLKQYRRPNHNKMFVKLSDPLSYNINVFFIRIISTQWDRVTHIFVSVNSVVAGQVMACRLCDDNIYIYVYIYASEDEGRL